MAAFVAVHCGAGYHSRKKTNAYKALCKEACLASLNNYETSKDALLAVTTAVKCLENSPLTNAGFGSNLSWEGNVECDASVMNGNTLQYGACGAVTCLKNPIELASIICRKLDEKLALGRIPPCLLVGSGAEKWATHVGIPHINPNSLISDEAKTCYNSLKNKQSLYETLIGNEISPLDTVGAIFVDANGFCTAASSSGGIALKSLGRIGQAASYGCGCWSEVENEESYATSTTGCGEQLIKTLLAKTVVDDLKKNRCPAIALQNTLQTNFLESKMLQNYEEKQAGVIALKYNPLYGIGDIIWGHTTPSLCIGYASSYPSFNYKGVISRKKNEEQTVIGGASFTLSTIAELDAVETEIS